MNQSLARAFGAEARKYAGDIASAGSAATSRMRGAEATGGVDCGPGPGFRAVARLAEPGRPAETLARPSSHDLDTSSGR